MKNLRSPKLMFCILAMIALVLSTMMAACTTSETVTVTETATETATGPSTQTKTESKTTTETETQVFELKFSHHLSPLGLVAQALEEWANKVEENTNGQVKITIYPSGSLAKDVDAYDSTSGGVCDITYVNNVTENSRWSLNNITNVLSLPFPCDERGAEVWMQLWEEYPSMLDEFQGVKPLVPSVGSPTSIHTTELVRVPEDIKGMKIAVRGPKTVMLQSAGASPVSLGAGEWYMGVEKGVIDGAFAPTGVVVDRGVHEVLNYHLCFNLGQGGSVIIINSEVWDRLPPDVQQEIEALQPLGTELLAKAKQAEEDVGLDKCKAIGNEIVTISKEELKLWTDLAEPLAEDWITENESKGPAREIYEYAKELIDEAT
jgi:TRAP-type transport system periplasmic protein